MDPQPNPNTITNQCTSDQFFLRPRRNARALLLVNVKVTMLSKSKSNRGRSKMVKKPKQQWRVKKPTRNWLELPSDLMVNILQRLGVFDILDNAQHVCTSWYKICKDPAMWRVVYMNECSEDLYGRSGCKEMCKDVVDRSQGQLIDLTIIGFCDDELLEYVVNRSSQLKRLEVIQYDPCDCEIWSKALKKLPLLEELSLIDSPIWKEDIEVAGQCCPLLKTLKVNQLAGKLSDRLWDNGSDDDGDDDYDDDDDDDDDGIDDTFMKKLPLAIGKNLPKLTHLELIGNYMTNTGLQAILDGCCHLETLDLRRCSYINLKGALGKRCSQQVKYLKYPHDSLKGCPYNNYVLDDWDSEYDKNWDSDSNDDEL